ncbi:helix-turn-helix domain-containing protein [Larkinella sp. VNQ87]|uniref:helix-turn-helix domain-containing protein n=1 Tax=Larkinella sp. VNQ87 TaxID=3400921 RepID=UPI003C0E7CFF
MNIQNFKVSFMEDINERFIKVLDQIGLNGAQLAKESGIAESTVSNIRQGKTKPSTQLIEWILQKYEFVSAEYLFRGKGDVTIGGINTTQKQTGENLSQRVSIAKGYRNSIIEQDFEKLLKAKDETIAAMQRTIDLYEKMVNTK